MISVSESGELAEIWSMTKQTLQEKNNFPDTYMRLWFNDMKLVILTKDDAIFVINSTFKRDIVISKYLNVLKEALEITLGFSVNVQIRSDETEVESEKKQIKAAERANQPIVDPKKDLYSTVGNTAILNHASIPLAYSEYTFDNFIVGSSNKFAHATALAVADNPCHYANPLFIYGPSGLGKTHLLYAITDRIHRQYPQYKTVYVKGEDFTNQLIDAIGHGLTADFREKYRKVDILLIDDIHFIAGKVSTQEEFFNTFNDLYENNKQIILTSDRPPRDIQTLEERLRTRFEMGVTADIEPPDVELRSAIIRQKAEQIGISLPIEVINYIAENLKNNVRQLEGAVKRISAQSLLTGDPITMDLAIRCIADKIVGSEPVNVTIDKILTCVSSHYAVTIEDLKSKKRTSSIAFARHVAAYLIKRITDRSFPAIGKVFMRNYTTIMNSIDTVEKRIKSDPAFETELLEMEKIIRQR